MPTYNDPRNSDRNRITRKDAADSIALIPRASMSNPSDEPMAYTVPGGAYSADLGIPSMNGGPASFDKNTLGTPVLPPNTTAKRVLGPGFPSWGTGVQATPTVVPEKPQMQIPGIENSYAENAFNNTAKFLQERQAQIEDDYAKRKAELMSRYNLAPTSDERNRLSWMLAELEAQRAAATDAIGAAFGSAIKGNQQLGKQMSKAGARAAKQARRGANRAAAGADATVAKANAVTGGLAALGLGQSGVSGPAVAAGGRMRAQGAINAADRRQIGADDRAMLNYFAQSLRGQKAAQIGDAQRLAAGLSAEAQAQWDAMVQDRIQQERMAQMAALDNLESWRMDSTADAAERLAQNSYDKDMYYAGREDTRADRQSAIDYQQAMEAYEAATSRQAQVAPVSIQGQGPRDIVKADGSVFKVQPQLYLWRLQDFRARTANMTPEELPGARANFISEMDAVYGGDFTTWLSENNIPLERL